MFHSVARRYDVMNDLMSAGLHRAWKAQLVSMLRPSKTRPYDHLDVAGGTGDVAFRVLDAGGPATQVTVLDINESMLRVGAERAPEKYEGGVNFVTGNAESLPLPTPPSIRTRSPSASGTCRASISRSPRRGGC